MLSGTLVSGTHAWRSRIIGLIATTAIVEHGVGVRTIRRAVPTASAVDGDAQPELTVKTVDLATATPGQVITYDDQLHLLEQQQPAAGSTVATALSSPTRSRSSPTSTASRCRWSSSAPGPAAVWPSGFRSTPPTRPTRWSRYGRRHGRPGTSGTIFITAARAVRRRARGPADR